MGVFSKVLDRIRSRNQAMAPQLKADPGRGRSVVGSSPALRPNPEGQWDNVKYPDFAVDPGRDLTSKGQNTGTGWIDAPGTSHVHSFKYLDGRVKGQQRFVNVFLANSPSAGRSILSVRFKPSGKRGVTHYEYYFTNAEDGLRILNAMVMAAHPGEIVHRELILRRVPYRKVS